MNLKNIVLLLNISKIWLMEIPLDLNAKIRDKQKLTEKFTNPMTPMPSIE